ncbi:MAG TPA: ABC transporter ATP-binding protein [Thermoanaerobaculia bacterium]|jgi:ABC-2 type transport system ATP-binding protein|nr:ABC transporter ATP-binding protein [Thermoanaerobaculia bacterium]
MSETLLAAREITKSYGPRRVLDGVSFTVRPGEVLGLIGPNGAGKTTLFECLAGVLPADAGEVRGPTGRALSPAERSGALFYVPDGIAPWPDQPVCRVLLFFRDLWGVAAERVAAIAGALQLRTLLGAPVGSLSKGERKRFLIALGLLAPQPLLMLDEPFDGLDLRQTREATTILRDEAARGRTLFLSIHQLTDAGRACDRFVLLAAGRVAGEGTLPQLRERAGAPEGGVEEVFLALT